jgi:hypothetical protein
MSPIREPKIKDVQEALAIGSRADDLYEWLRTRHHPDVPRNEELPYEIATSLRNQAFLIALVEWRRQ